MPDSTLRELLASGGGSCSAGEEGSVRQRLVDLVHKLPFALHDCQLDALEVALTGSDFVVRMGTGWGKTLTYLLYVLALRAPAVLITPLVALREDQLRELNQWGRLLGFEYDVAVALRVRCGCCLGTAAVPKIWPARPTSSRNLAREVCSLGGVKWRNFFQ